MIGRGSFDPLNLEGYAFKVLREEGVLVPFIFVIVEPVAMAIMMFLGRQVGALLDLSSEIPLCIATVMCFLALEYWAGGEHEPEI